MDTDWWTPDPDDPTVRPWWPSIDLEKSRLALVILVRADGSMRRVLHPGTATLAWTLPRCSDAEALGLPPGELQVVVPEGECRIVRLPDPEPDWKIR